MKPILIAGTTIVNFALISYTIFLYFERKTRRAGNKVLLFLTLGVILDSTATICMIIGSTKSPFTIHGILGYSSLTGMLTDTFLTWRNRLKNGDASQLSNVLHNYTLFAYCWWILAYITGAILVMLR